MSMRDQSCWASRGWDDDHTAKRGRLDEDHHADVKIFTFYHIYIYNILHVCQRLNIFLFELKLESQRRKTLMIFWIYSCCLPLFTCKYGEKTPSQPFYSNNKTASICAIVSNITSAEKEPPNSPFPWRARGAIYNNQSYSREATSVLFTQ